MTDEDTNGEPLKNTTLKLPDLPLLEKAREWKISVKAVPGNYRYYGYFSEGQNVIALATTEETVFFHELAHAAYARLHKSPNHSNLSERCDPCTEEIVAELSAAALCAIVGKTSDTNLNPDSKYLGNNYYYIKRYAEKQNLSPVKACLKVLLDVESTLKMILDNPCDQEPEPASIS